MEILRLNMDEYIQSGEGANGASYDSKADPEIMVKMYFDNYSREAIFSEQETAEKVYSLGIPSPAPGELVTDGSRLGIRFRRIRGKRSFSRMLADEPERYDEYAREMARYWKKLHSVECPDGLFPNVKDQFLELLSHDKAFTPEQQKVMADFIRNAPDGNTAVHGDMHMGNIISTLPKGAPLSSPHEVYFIDLGYFATGCPLFDFGMLQNICLWADNGFRFHDFHINGDLTAKVWDSFVDEYFFGPERLGEKWFGPGATPHTVCEGIKPYYAVKMLLVEFNLGFMPENEIKMISEFFGF